MEYRRVRTKPCKNDFLGFIIFVCPYITIEMSRSVLQLLTKICRPVPFFLRDRTIIPGTLPYNNTGTLPYSNTGTLPYNNTGTLPEELQAFL
jgi:hypothetical protein